MEFLYLLEKIRVSGLNEFMLTITTLGEETAFLLYFCGLRKRSIISSVFIVETYQIKYNFII